MIEFDCFKVEDVVKEITFDNSTNSLQIVFNKSFENINIISPFNPHKIDKSLKDLEKKLIKEIPSISHEYIRIENAIIDNLDKLITYPDNTENKNTQRHKIHYIRKYEKDGELYESILVSGLPKFILVNDNGYKLFDEIEVGNYVLRPNDDVTTHNPIPYSFESERELDDYLEEAKNETFNTLFEKTLGVFRNYVNTEEHSLVILAADTVYSYFQDKFGTTHYNIFVGEVGSGKNSALLVFRILGYRVFYITSASAPNYFTFLGDIQEGQGTIAEDEADNIGRSIDKKNILKTGYSSGSSVPKVGFTNNGTRYQNSYLTFCHKWFAMEELPDDKNNRGTFDRSFVHYFMKGDVRYNIKEIIKDKDSKLNKDLIHLRKLLFAYKLTNYNIKFSTINTNLTARDAELTHFLLRMFLNSKSFEKIRSALSQIIYEKSSSKNNSIESKITETLKQIIETEQDNDRIIIEFSNENFYSMFKEIAEAKDNAFDVMGSTLYLPDGTKLSKYKLSKLLTSKFKAKAIRTNQFRGYSINKKDIEKISKQYEIINEIKILDYKYSGLEDGVNNNNGVTEMTQVTDLKCATPLSDTQINQEKDNRSRIQNTESNSEEIISETNILEKKPKSNESNTQSIENKENKDKNESLVSNGSPLLKDNDSLERPSTPLKSVTSVTRVTTSSPQYPCYFCGNNYMTHIDFDMDLHLYEKHREQLIKLPIPGNLDKRMEWVISTTKGKMVDNSLEDGDNE